MSHPAKAASPVMRAMGINQLALGVWKKSDGKSYACL